MWAWVGWDLPGRCETAAKALQTRAGMRAALRSAAPAPDAPISADAPSGEPPKNIDDALSAGAASPGAAPVGAASDQAPAPSLRGPQ